MVLRKTYRGKPHPNSDLWHAMRPIAGKTWADSNFQTTDTLLRGAGLTNACVTIVHLVRRGLGIDDAGGVGPGKTLFSTGVSGANGYAMRQIAPSMSSTYGRFEMLLGASGGGGEVIPMNQDDAGDLEDVTLDLHRPFEGRVQITGFSASSSAYDDPQSFPFINGRDMRRPSWTDHFLSGSAGPAASLRLMKGHGATSVEGPTDDYLIGYAVHEDPITPEEAFLLTQEVMLARDIPEIPQLGGPTFDYIWSVKRHMGLGVGSSAVFSPWSSDGASPSKDFAINGTVADLEVVQLNADLGVR